MMSPTKVEPHLLDPDYYKFHSHVSNLLTFLVWKFILSVCLDFSWLVWGFSLLVFWLFFCLFVFSFFLMQNHLVKPALLSATSCIFCTHNRSVGSPLCMMMSLVFHRLAKVLDVARNRDVPHPSFSRVITGHRNPTQVLLLFPSRSCPQFRAHPCSPHFAPAVCLAAFPTASALLCCSQP